MGFNIKKSKNEFGCFIGYVLCKACGVVNVRHSFSYNTDNIGYGDTAQIEAVLREAMVNGKYYYCKNCGCALLEKQH